MHMLPNFLPNAFSFSDYFSDDVNLDSLEPSMQLSMPPPHQQQSHKSQGPMVPMQGSSSAYTTKEYDAAHMLVNYSQHPTRQSSAIPTPGLMSSQAQPLYSQAVYTPRGINDGQQHIPSGLQQCPPPSRSASTIGSMASAYSNPCTPQSLDSVTNMGRAANIVNQPASTSCFDYVPQILAAAVGVSTAANTLNTSASSFPFIGSSNFSNQDTR